VPSARSTRLARVVAEHETHAVAVPAVELAGEGEVVVAPQQDVAEARLPAQGYGLVEQGDEAESLHDPLAPIRPVGSLRLLDLRPRIREVPGSRFRSGPGCRTAPFPV